MTLAFQPFASDDIPPTLEMMDDPRVSRFGAGPSFKALPPTEKEAMFRRISYFTNKPDFFYFSLRKNATYAGFLAFVPHPKLPYHRSISYCLPYPMWGKGIATEAIQRVQYHLYSTKACTGMSALVQLGNTASMRVLEKRMFHHADVISRDGSDVNLMVWAAPDHVEASPLT